MGRKRSVREVNEYKARCRERRRSKKNSKRSDVAVDMIFMQEVYNVNYIVPPLRRQQLFKGGCCVEMEYALSWELCLTQLDRDFATFTFRVGIYAWGISVIYLSTLWEVISLF